MRAFQTSVLQDHPSGPVQVDIDDPDHFEATWNMPVSSFAALLLRDTRYARAIRIVQDADESWGISINEGDEIVPGVKNFEDISLRVHRDKKAILYEKLFPHETGSGEGSAHFRNILDVAGSQGFTKVYGMACRNYGAVKYLRLGAYFMFRAGGHPCEAAYQPEYGLQADLQKQRLKTRADICRLQMPASLYEQLREKIDAMSADTLIQNPLHMAEIAAIPTLVGSEPAGRRLMQDQHGYIVMHLDNPAVRAQAYDYCDGRVQRAKAGYKEMPVPEAHFSL